MPRVAVIIPAYNAEAWIAEAIASVMCQTYRDWELIVIDDGSTDRTRELAERFAATDRRVRVYSDDVNRGLIARLNQMADLTQAEFIARFDSDDVMLQERLALQVAAFDADPTLDVLGGAAYSIDADSAIVGFRDATRITDATDFLAAPPPLVHPSVMARRSWFARNKYDPGFPRAEDFELWWRTSKTSKIRNLTEPLIFYREVGMGSTQKYRATSASLRKLWVRQVKDGSQRVRAAWLIVRSYLMDAVYALSSAVGIVDRLIRARSAKPTADQLSSGSVALTSIRRLARTTLEEER